MLGMKTPNYKVYILSVLEIRRKAFLLLMEFSSCKVIGERRAPSHEGKLSPILTLTIIVTRSISRVA